jgi:hypothetical protein
VSTQHRFTRLARLLATAMTAAALAAPAAVARPALDPPPSAGDRAATTAIEPEPNPAEAPVVVRQIDTAFDWGSAAIGAGGAGALLVLVSLGGFFYATRNRIQAKP